MNLMSNRLSARSLFTF